MKTGFCPYEPRVVKSVRTGQWDDVMRAHYADCPACQEASHIAQSISDMASNDILHAPTGSDPQLIWLKASFAARQKRQRLVSLIATGTYSALVAAASAGAFMFLKAGSSAMGHAGASSPFPRLPLPGGSAVPLLALVVGVLVLLVLSFPLPKKSH